MSLSLAQQEEGLILRLKSKAFEFQEKYLLTKTYADVDDDCDEEQKSEQFNPPTVFDFTHQSLIKEGVLNDMESILVLPKLELNIKLKLQLVEDPSREVLMKA